MIAQIIEARYPEANLAAFTGNVELTDFGPGLSPSGQTGIHITRWELPYPKPTITELEEWAAKNPDKMVPKTTEKEKAIANLRALKGKNPAPDVLIDTILAVIDNL